MIDCHSDNLYLLMQLSDSSFPGGSLANSNGLESAIQHYVVNRGDLNQLVKFIDMTLEQVSYIILCFIICNQWWFISGCKSGFTFFSDFTLYFNHRIITRK